MPSPVRRARQQHVLMFAALVTGFSCASSVKAQDVVSNDQRIAEVYTLIDAGRLQAAETQARSYVAAHPASADGHFLCGYILFRNNKPADSLSEYTRAAQLQRPTAADLHNVALDYVLLNDYTDADTWMTRATQWQPANATYWYDLGRIKSSENRFDEAIRCFTQSLKIDPTSVKATNNLGIADEGLNRTQDAIAAYRRAIELAKAKDLPEEEASPDSPALPLFHLGRILTEEGRFAEAKPLLDEASGIAKHDPEIHRALGFLCEHMGDFKQAQAAFELAVDEKPSDPSLRFQLGTVYKKEGLADLAQREFAQAAALNATHSTPAP